MRPVENGPYSIPAPLTRKGVHQTCLVTWEPLVHLRLPRGPLHRPALLPLVCLEPQHLLRPQTFSAAPRQPLLLPQTYLVRPLLQHLAQVYLVRLPNLL